MKKKTLKKVSHFTQISNSSQQLIGGVLEGCIR